MSKNSGKKSKAKSSVASKTSNNNNKQQLIQQINLSFSQKLIQDVLQQHQQQQKQEQKLTNIDSMDIQTNLNASLLQCLIQKNMNSLNQIMKQIYLNNLSDEVLEENIENFVSSKVNQLAQMLITSIQENQKRIFCLQYGILNYQKLRVLNSIVICHRKKLTKNVINEIQRISQNTQNIKNNNTIQMLIKTRGKINLLCS